MKKLLTLVFVGLILAGCSAKPADFNKVEVFNKALENHRAHELIDLTVSTDFEVDMENSKETVTASVQYIGNKNFKNANDLAFAASLKIGKSGFNMETNAYAKDGVGYIGNPLNENVKFKIDDIASHEEFSQISNLMNLTDLNFLELTEDSLNGMVASKTSNGYMFTISGIEDEAMKAIKTALEIPETEDFKIEDLKFEMTVSDDFEFKTLNVVISVKSDDGLVTPTLNVVYNGFDDAVKLEFPDFGNYKAIER